MRGAIDKVWCESVMFFCGNGDFNFTRARLVVPLPWKTSPPLGASVVGLFRPRSRTPFFDDLAKFRRELLHDVREIRLKIGSLLRVIVQVEELDGRETLAGGLGLARWTPTA